MVLMTGHMSLSGCPRLTLMEVLAAVVGTARERRLQLRSIFKLLLAGQLLLCGWLESDAQSRPESAREGASQECGHRQK
jgi:hypothetical protein